MKSCFVISPIGPDGSDVRRRADLTLRHIIQPACAEHGYEALRADRISDPGMITAQIIAHIINDEMVVADLSGHNPNVFYELAIRHTFRKPVVQIIAKGEALPFDVASSRTIFIDLSDPDNVVASRMELSRQIKLAEESPRGVDTPVSTAIDWDVLRRSEDPPEKRHLELLEQFQDIRTLISRLMAQSQRQVNRQHRQPDRRRMVFTVDYSDVDPVGRLQYDDTFDSFQAFLNSCFSDVMVNHVHAFTYGKDWIFVDAESGEAINKVGSRDMRSLDEAGIRDGCHLRVELIDGGREQDT